MNLEKLRTLWDGHARSVYAYLLRLTKCEADAADFLQDIYCRLGRQPDLVEKLSVGDARGYLLRLAHNAVVDQARRARARERIFEKITTARAGEFALNASPDEALLRRELVAALAELPEEQRVVVHGRLWKLHTLDEIAHELGISINTAASRYRYGIDKMRTRLRSLYEDFAPRPPTKSSQLMKDNSKNPSTDPAEEPIIRPLEQRRVPSATGAVFALPVVPEAPEDVHVDDVPAHVEMGVDPESFDPHFVVDHLPIEGGDEGELPFSFDDVAMAIENGDDLGGAGGGGEDFDPELIFWTLAAGEVTDGDHVEHFDGGAGGGVIAEPIVEVPADNNGNGVADHDVVVPVSLIGKSNIFHPLNDGTDHSHDLSTTVSGTVSASGASGESMSTLTLVNRSVGGPSASGSVTNSTDVVYLGTGGATGTTDVAHDPDPTPVHVEHAIEHAATEHHAADQTHESALTPTGTVVPMEVTFQTSNVPGAPLVLHDTDAAVVIHLDDLHSPASVTSVGHDLHPIDYQPAPLSFGSNSVDMVADHHDTTHAEVTVDQWVPAHSDAEPTGLVAHFDGLTADAPSDQSEIVIPFDAGALTTGHDAALHGRTLAMAATGAVLLTREGKKRDDKEQA